MKVGLIYTGITPELKELVEKEIKAQLGNDVEMLSWKDPSIIQDAGKFGYVTKELAARLVSMYMEAVNAGCDAIINLCSSVGEVADACQDLAKYMGVPIVRVDEEMCRDAARKALKIGVVATLRTTLDPTKGTIARTSREIGRHVEMVDILVDGAFGLDQEQFKAGMLEETGKYKDDVDVFLFAQGSMAYCGDVIEQAYGKKVFSSPSYGAAALKKALEFKGTI